MIKAWLRKWLGVDAQQAGTGAPEANASTPKKAMQINQFALDVTRAVEEITYEVKMPILPDGVVPASGMAMDSAGQAMCAYANSNGFCGMGFIGYPELSNFAVISEYRSPVETLAAEMTREWIKVKSSGDDDVSEKITVIEAQLKRHKIRELFKEAAEKDGFFGRAQIYINIKNDKEELPLVMSPATIKKGDLAGFKLIEPMWTSPAQYDSSNPTDSHFFKPMSWYVMGRSVHSGRLLTFVSRPVPDILKPAYNFGGLSMSQLMRPYVESWHRAREAVSNLLDSFSTNGILTNREDVLSGGSATNVVKRAQLYNQMRKNSGLLLMDKDSEEFFQFNAPLSGVDKLQAQAQEQMAAPCHMPLVKLLGITPSGLNASSEGELVVWYDYVHSMQESLFGEHLTKVINLIQLDQFGEIDPNIEFEFVPLRQLSEEQWANVRKTDADTAAALIANGIISAEEERARLAADKDSVYSSIDVENTPEIPDSNRPDDELDDDSGVAQDADFIESEHPRNEKGEFSTLDGAKRYSVNNLPDLANGFIRLYHGSFEKDIPEVKSGGVFGGLFTNSSYSSAESHGKHLHFLDVEESRIATNSMLRDMEEKHPDVVDKVLSKFIFDNIDSETREQIVDALVRDESVFDMDDEIAEKIQSLIYEDDKGEASWKLQKMRGALAREFGFSAVEMNDEHGTSHLVFPGKQVFGIDV